MGFIFSTKILSPSAFHSELIKYGFMAPGALKLRRAFPGRAEPLRGQVLRVGPKCQPCSTALLLKAGCVFWVCDEPPQPLGVSIPGNSGNPCLPSSDSRSRPGALCRERQLSLRAHSFQSDSTPGRGLLLRTLLPDGGLVNPFRSLWSLTNPNASFIS